MPRAQRVALMNWQGHLGTGFRTKSVRCWGMAQFSVFFHLLIGSFRELKFIILARSNLLIFNF